MTGFDSLITNNEIGFLPIISDTSNLFQKEIFHKAKNIAILKYLTK